MWRRFAGPTGGLPLPALHVSRRLLLRAGQSIANGRGQFRRVGKRTPNFWSAEASVEPSRNVAIGPRFMWERFVVRERGQYNRFGMGGRVNIGRRTGPYLHHEWMIAAGELHTLRNGAGMRVAMGNRLTVEDGRGWATAGYATGEVGWQAAGGCDGGPLRLGRVGYGAIGVRCAGLVFVIIPAR